MRKINNIFLLLLALSFGACSDFLEEKPEGVLPMEDAIESVDDCEKFLTGVYSSFKQSNSIAGAGILAPELQTDMMLLVLGNQQNFVYEHNWTFTSQMGQGISIWQAYYSTIFRANFLIQEIPMLVEKLEKRLESSLILDADKAEIASQLKRLEQINAECHMARAFCRVELVKLFADAYNPDTADKQLGLAIWNNTNVGTPKRVTMKEYYNSVLSDLEVASKITTIIADQTRFTAGAVLALKVRVAAYMQDWKAVKNYSSAIINTGVYSLLEGTAYQDMWINDKGNEIIWKLGYTSADETLVALGGVFCALKSKQLLPDYIPAKDFYDLYQGADIRISTFFLADQQTDYSHGLVATIFTKYPGNSSLNQNASNPRYVNMPKIFRLSEIYLWKAEAHYHLGEEGEALSTLHAFQNKRNVTVSSISGESLYAEIKKERIKELCMEGHRLYDLKRYKQGFKRSPMSQTVPSSSTLAVDADNVRFTWPIPKQELDVANSQMVGNASNAI
ncbi:MAG: RagB/SusD family nutrient uptake outer membrane protein [Marinifilaceae bacterium]